MAAIWISRRSNVAPYAWTDADTGLTGNNPRIYMEKGSGRIHLLYDDGTTSYSRYSDDDGWTWSSAVSIGTGTHPAAVFLKDGCQALYRLDGTALKGIVRDRSLATVEASFTAVSPVTAASSFAVGAVAISGRLQKVVIACVEGGTVGFRTSGDGVTFGSATALEAGSYPDIVIGPDNLLHLYWTVATNIRGAVYDSTFTLIEAIATVLGSVTSGSKSASAWTVEQGRAGKIVMLAIKTNQVQEFSSTDGMSFS